MQVWIIHVAIFVVWFAIASFLWNNIWRGTSDQAQIYRGPISGFSLILLCIVLPIISILLKTSFKFHVKWIIIIAAIYLTSWFVISEWRYLVVFKQYKKIYMHELQEKGELASKTKAEIDQLVKEWLHMNVKSH